MKKATPLKKAAPKKGAVKQKAKKPPVTSHEEGGKDNYKRDFTVLEITIIDNLRLLRKEQGLTLDKWASVMRVGVSYVKGYDSSKTFRYVPSIEYMIRVADYTGVSLDWICGRTDRRKRTKKG